MRSSLSTLCLILPLCVACDDLELREDDAEPVGEVDSGRPIEPDAPRTRSVDATSETGWVYLDLDRDVPTTTDPSALPGWDVALSRFKIKLNGGVSGSAGVEASLKTGAVFDGLTEAPTDGWASDGPDGSDTDLDPEYVLSSGDGGWWDYDPTSHKLTPRPHVYFVHSTDRAFFKLEVTGYYNQAGSSGYPTLRWAPVKAPAGPLVPRTEGGTGPYDGGAPDATTSASRAM